MLSIRPGYRSIHVGVQRRDRRVELLELHHGDAPSATWELEATATRTEAGWDLRGPRRVQPAPNEASTSTSTSLPEQQSAPPSTTFRAAAE
ncbi:DUF5990 family protein [Streptomyces sp. NPDC059909]|uniref:DUF5990 family protein n=1 Tax=Streptomyces sp. NPDC059909 TaxID=3346998 RepID=UPI00366897B8